MKILPCFHGRTALALTSILILAACTQAQAHDSMEPTHLAPALGAGPGEFQIKERLNKLMASLVLTDDQRAKSEPVVFRHEDEIAAIVHDDSLPVAERKKKVKQNLDKLADELQPILTADQNEKLRRKIAQFSKQSQRDQIASALEQLSISYSRFIPSSPTMRDIFGNAPNSIGIEFGERHRDIHKRVWVGVDTDFFTIPSSYNKLFVGSVQAEAEFREPLAKKLFAFSKISAGPAYMDYSFDYPDGSHEAAKHLAAEAGIEVGLNFRPVEISAKYRFLTQPAGFTFNGWELSASLTLFKF